MFRRRIFRPVRCGLALALAGPALALAASAAPAHADPSSHEARIASSRTRWLESPHGPMLARILPPTFPAARLPQPDSTGADLVVRYCVQCHNLPNPAMHHAEKWPGIVERMVFRMRGNGNMGALMAEMMAGVAAPSDAEAAALLAYLQKHAQTPLDPHRIADLGSAAAAPFRLACAQCHVLPDPGRYTAREWPAVVARMAQNMQWMNRVVGTRPVHGEPQLRIADINAYLARHAKRAHEQDKSSARTSP